MFTQAALLDAHALTHRGTAALLEHCAQFSAEELEREHPGFGYPSLTEQWRHIIGAEDYWLAVLRGEWDIPDHAAACHTVAELEGRRAVVAGQTADYLRASTNNALNSPARLATWPEGRQRELVPARIVMRVITHAFHHRGQVVAICRLLAKPAPPSDFPVATG